MSTLYLDLETFSEEKITVGTYRYAESSEILLCAYALDDEPVKVWDVTESSDMPDSLSYALVVCDDICAHNSQFDRTILEFSPYAKYFEGYTWHDTMIRAYAHSLPGSLDMLSQIFALDADKAKDKEGKKLIQLFCKIQNNGTRATRGTHPDKWKEFINYARLDIESMRALDKKIPTWNDSAEEREYFLLDQKINGRGFAVDTELAEAAIRAVEIVKEANDKRTAELTDGDVGAATQRDALLEHILKEYGVSLPNMQISTLERRLSAPDLPDAVKELIALRLEAAGTATKKYNTLLSSVSADSRLRGTLQFCGASRTGRFGGRIFQPQNLPRPALKNELIDFGIETLKADSADLFFDDVKKLASSAIRGVIIAPDGKKLVVADLSAIEGRVLAWLAGEQWKLDAYAEYDRGIGYDMYILTYAKTFKVDPSTVTKYQRQMGKVLELALGYGGGAGAFLQFSKVYNINLEGMVDDGGLALIPGYILKECENYYQYAEENGRTLGLSKEVFILCDGIKRMWRESNPKIAEFWQDLEMGVRDVLNKRRYNVKLLNCEIDKKGVWLRIKLPSGRYLSYPRAKIEENKIKYQGSNQYTRKWDWLTTYGGKLVENVTQAVARDILMYGMLNAENEGYEVILSVHDELLTETPNTNDFTHTGLSAIMSTAPDWAHGLPLAAAGFESKRYKKD